MESLWEFALAYYAQPQIADTCVQLQDHYGVNVCLLIALRWADERGMELAPDAIFELEAACQPWLQSVVAPLRQVRRELKSPFAEKALLSAQGEVRQLIKEAELLSEKALLEMLSERMLVLPQAKSASPASLTCYLEYLAVPLELQRLLRR
jgi:uncharacterized protein (TIGR02444 family)